MAKIFAVDIPGLDRRRVSDQWTPFVSRLVHHNSVAVIEGQPTTELWPTMVTGVHPGQHKIWHCRIRDEVVTSRLDRFLCALPDWLVTTLQLIPHWHDRQGFDMPAIPHWRRRRLQMQRLKYNMRWQEPERFRTVGGVPSIFGVLGERANYYVTNRMEELDSWVELLPEEPYAFQFFEIHALDLVQHWHLDEPEVLRACYRKVDEVCEQLYEKCRESGYLFSIVSDHGQEPIHRRIDLLGSLRSAGISQRDYTYFIAIAVARFWFDTGIARRVITKKLERTEGVTVMTNAELCEKFGFELDDGWGELYAIADRGSVFHPNDFHHPLANLFLAVTEPSMRRRILAPSQKGYHGYGSGHPADDGFVLFADPRVRFKQEPMNLVDYVPTMLDLMGEERSEFLVGRSWLDSSPI